MDSLTLLLPAGVRHDTTNTTADYLWTVNYYDDEGKIVRAFKQHCLGGASSLNQYNYDDVSTKYNFVQQPVKVTRTHYMKNVGGTAGTLVLTSTDSLVYDHVGRKLKTINTLKDGANAAQASVTVSNNIYNEIGQLKQKRLHSLNGTGFLQNVDYRYNTRGWVTNVNNGALSNDPLTSTDTNDQFGMDLKYDDAGTPQYNGNIGSAKTLTGALSGTTPPALTYNYKYDKLNRIVNAISTTAIPNDNFYNENFSYDVMGNMVRLNRYDNSNGLRTVIDSLSFGYVSGNKVDRIDDVVAGGTIGFFEAVKQAGEYTYDGNGNQLADLNKGLTQGYNMLNLPQTVTKSGVSVAYIYDATGRKLRKLSTSGSITTVTEYIDGIQYEYNGTTPVLSFIQTEEGRARKNGSVYKYEYDLKDHLGDTRITLTWNAADATQMTPVNLQRNDYYAFGYTIQSLIGTTPSPQNYYLYNHKELQAETGFYDYGWRFYDPVTARFTTIDPSPDDGDQELDSPYGYVGDNPVVRTDPDGRFWNVIIGAAIGGIIGGAIEAGSQIYHSGKVTSWRAVGGSVAQGAITGAVAGATGGASLLVNVGANAGANIVGGVVNRAIQGKSTTLKDVAVDGALGGGFALAGAGAGKLMKNGLNKLSNQAKGRLGEMVTKLKYGAKGYISEGTADVATGTKAARGVNVDRVAKYDHDMKNVFTGKRLTVESKFNTSGLTPNQAAARSSVSTEGGLIVNRTTSSQFGKATQSAVTAGGGQASAVINKQ